MVDSSGEFIYTKFIGGASKATQTREKPAKRKNHGAERERFH